nr:MAG TPA: hypothetical protein [Caudoviricetes sp.]DAP53603.1 MAG TPA: hypothetical protein [Caudoviricetes sp.]
MIIFTFCIIFLIMAFVGIVAPIYIMFSRRRKFEKFATIVYVISAIICQGVTIAFSVLVLFVW